jgi:RNA polymerase sigma factor (sigma-70 family)
LQTFGDEELIERMRSDPSSTAHQELTLRYLPFTRRFVARHAWRAGLAPDHVPDAEQQAALALLEAMARFDLEAFQQTNGCNFERYLTLVLRSRFLDYVKMVRRSERRLDRASSAAFARNGQPAADEVAADRGHSEGSRPSDPAYVAEKREQMAGLTQVIAALTGSKRFLLDRLTSGAKLPAIARELGISYHAARRRLRKTISLISSALKERRLF